MPTPSPEQMANVAERFLAIITARVEVYKAEKSRNKAPVEWLKRTEALHAIVQHIPRLRQFGTPASFESCGEYRRNAYENSLGIKFPSGWEVRLRRDAYKPLTDFLTNCAKEKREYEQESTKLCNRIETLTNLHKTQGINAFKAYVRSRWVPLDRKTEIPDHMLRLFLTDFLAARQGFTCSV